MRLALAEQSIKAHIEFIQSFLELTDDELAEVLSQVHNTWPAW